MNRKNHTDLRRQHLAQEAARILAERGDDEFERARRKAAEKSGVSNRRLWPSNEEIQAALEVRQRLFPDRRQATLAQLRLQALRGMRHLAAFAPRLVGPVLDGSAEGTHPVRLLVFVEPIEALLFALLDQGIVWRQREQRQRFSDGTRRHCPLIAFLAGETDFELLVLPPTAMSNPPLNPLDDRPLRGATAEAVERMLREPEGSGPG